ncbi:hypothetical protein BH11PLA2_BH11PLA2_47540 [soil metagenome]
MASDTIDERLARLEASVSRSAPTAEQIAEQVLVVLSEKTRQRTDSPSGLVPVPQFISANAPPPGAMPNTPEDSVRHWLFHGLLSELRLIPGMYFDSRYRLSRLCQIAVPCIFVLLVINYLFFNYSLGFIPAVPQILERVIILILGVLLYKVLSREADRYRGVLEYLARYR